MANKSEIDISSVEEWKLSEPCAVPNEECGNAATCVVWCDHHSLGCDYTGYRCDIHRNMLLLETRRMIDHLERGGTALCSRCKQEITGAKMEDHIRWIPL